MGCRGFWSQRGEFAYVAVYDGGASADTHGKEELGEAMIVLRVIVNALIMAGELAAVVAISWLGLNHPYIFAALTGLVAFAIGVNLDFARLRHDYPFYFDREAPKYAVALRLVALGDSLIKGAAAALIALVTFSGTDSERTFYVAIVFGVAVYFGASILRRLAMSLRARPARWGFFRLAVPLGLTFSSGIALLAALAYIKVPTLYDLGRQIVFEMPEKPGIDAASDLLFNLKQYIDGLIATLLNSFMPADWAQILGLVISVNVLTGFVVAVYAVVIAQSVWWLEGRMRF